MVDRTPKRLAKQALDAPQFNDIFEAIRTGSSEVPTASDKKDDVGVQLQALNMRVDQLLANNEMYRPQMQQSSPQHIQVVAAPAPIVETMPDPVLNSEDYTAWLIERSDALVKSKIDDFRREQAEQANSDDAYDRLWTGFLAIEGNESWEKSPEKVQVAALKVAKNLWDKGIDLNTYMFQHSDKYFTDIRKTLDKDFGKPDAADDDDTADADDADRTGGIAGGQTSPVVAKGADNKPLPDLTSDLVAIQRKGGWY